MSVTSGSLRGRGPLLEGMGRKGMGKVWERYGKGMGKNKDSLGLSKQKWTLLDK